jgi:hypothetical protein
MKKIIFTTINEEKINVRKEMDLSFNAQQQMINMLYMNDEFEFKKELLTELNKKRNGYKQQDRKKEIFSEYYFITHEQMVEKLVQSKLSCHYCKTNVLLFFKNKREPTQWTLDRINNDLAHTNSNTIVSCLKCNLDRRVKNIDVFTFSKQLKITKKSD